MADSPQSASPVPPTGEATHLKLHATESLHGDFLEKASPQWLIDATSARKQALKEAGTKMPAWFQNASPEQRSVVTSSVLDSFIAQTRLDKTMSTFLDINDFARPLLLKALKDQYQVQVDVDKTLLCLRRPLAIGIAEIELASFDFLKLSMLDAALHNFEAYECEEGAYHNTSGFIEATDTPGTYHAVTVNLTVSQFLSLCRSLDIGAKYQAYLQGFFYPEEGATQVTLREHFVASHKAAVKAAAEQALLKGDIEPADHRMIVSVINGEVHPWMGDKQVWFRTFSLMKLRLSGCIAFVICKKYTYPDELILYIPQDPEHPLKRYRWSQMEAEFKRLFTARGSPKPDDPSPTPYQVFFSQFVPYEKRGYYFSQFTQKAADSPTDVWRSPWRKIIDFVTPHFITGIKELPPEKPAKLEPNNNPYLSPSTLVRRGHGIWAENIDLWKYSYEQHRERLIADARAHAVPAADVDARAREAKLAHLLELGMLGLNMISMFVPVLGEVMMVVMAGQLLYETLEGAIEWGEGDLKAAKAHLIEVAENLAQIALMAGVGAGVNKWKAANPEPVIEALSQVKQPDGQVRLWKPSLSRYESPVTLGAELRPNTMGQYVKEGRTYIREGSKVYEQYFDDSLKKWRIKHPSDSEAYQPILNHNGRGAWQHTLERPLEWDRTTLLRRMGHETEMFTDQELLKIADVSGISDNTLRKMHVDHTVAPPELQDSLRLFKADADVARVIKQLEGAQPIDDLYLYALPLITDMPRWPSGRVLEVFEGNELSGKSVKYTARHASKGAAVKPSIKVHRADVLGGNLSRQVLAGLDETEVVQLLGAEPARVYESRPQEFDKQLVDYARQCQPAIFDSIYKGTEPVNSRIQRLQRVCPGLSEAAAQTVIDHALPDEIVRFDTTQRVPLNMLEEARWYAREGRVTCAYAGLRSEVMGRRDSRRLALRALEKLPGWPSTLRLQVRDGSTHGTLLDSIGADTASEKKYVVKQGPTFQAFDEQGQALNSIPRVGDNFFASLMHAMPDEARQSLGLPQVSQHAELQQKIIELADRHRIEAPGWLETPGRTFKPPVRVSATLLGYYASGRGPGLNPAITREVNKVYPDMQEEHVRQFLFEQAKAGKNGREIATLLRERFNERVQLESTLEQWVNNSGSNRVYNEAAAYMLKRSWSRSFLAGKEPGADGLTMTLADPLPPLTADFSHVRELWVGGAGIHDGSVDGLLRSFPKVEKLSIDPPRMTSPTLANVPQALSELQGLKHLALYFNAARLAPELPSRLAALTRLESLEVGYFGFSGDSFNALDLTPLRQLKKLTIKAPYVPMRWPAYVQQLRSLERLDLGQTTICELPISLYTRHEWLWAGLSLDWSKFTYEAFMPAYGYITTYKGTPGLHVVNLDEMVRGFARGELAVLMNMNRISERLTNAVMARWDTAQTRMAAVEVLRAEYAGIFGKFYRKSPVAGFRNQFAVDGWRAGANAKVLRALESNWRDVVRKRYGLEVDNDITTLQLPDDILALVDLNEERITELPVLPAGTFSHVKTLNLSWLDGLPAAQVSGFVRAFEGVENLSICYSRLTEIPTPATGLPELARLDLSDNSIVVTPAVQAQLNQLKNLQVLNLQNNLLGTLDASELTKLTALNLRQTHLQAWPTGVERLGQLTGLDLRDNQLTTLTPAVLSHPDVLLCTELAGNRFSPEGEAALNTARAQIETTRGLPGGTLSRFAQEPAPPIFAQTETAASIAAHLLPPLPAIEGAMGPAERLLRLNSTLTPEQAALRLEQLRNTGMDAEAIDTQINQWSRDHDELTRQLNGWIFTRQVRTANGLIGAQSRSQAAATIRSSWQQGVVAGRTGAAVESLSLQGLQTGDLPELAVQLPHVRSLDLTAVQLTNQGSNGFLGRFPQLTRLILSGDELTVLPEAVQHMGQLEHLALYANQFQNASSLSGLAGERLRWLDLSHNDLQAFDARPFTRLETLNLGYNRIAQWPDGLLDAQHVTTLDLSGNSLTEIPDDVLLDGQHDGLVLATDLSENELNPYDLRAMRDYGIARGRTQEVMGISRGDMDRAARRLDSDYEPGSDSQGSDNDSSDPDSDGDSNDAMGQVQAPEVLVNPHADVAPAALEPWLSTSGRDEVAQRTTLWNQLAQTPGHERFFHLISTLRNTSEFTLRRSVLIQRLWDLMANIAENAELRALAFVEAETHAACGDGRILTFSEMSVRAYEYRALRGLPPGNSDLRGRALLDLARQLFRLQRTEELAEAAAIHADRAEVRLEYRIGLTSGWPDGLELPGQPSSMLYGRPIGGMVLARARAGILAAENSTAFIEYLVGQPSWVGYLEQRYAGPLAALTDEFDQRLGTLEDEHIDRSDAASLQRYEVALGQLEVERLTARTQKLMELSRTEMQRLASIGRNAPVPAPPSPQPGPSWRT